MKQIKRLRQSALLLVLVLVAIGFVSGPGTAHAAAGPDFRIITVEAEYGQLIVEAQHFHPNGDHWFFEHYTFQGREAFKFPWLTRDRLERSSAPSLDQESILHTIRSIHAQRVATGWTKGAQRLTTTPLDFNPSDLFGANLLADRFKSMEDATFIADARGDVALYTNPVPPADMAVGPEFGTVSTFFPDSEIESTSVDGEVWQNPDGATYFISDDADDVTHFDHSLAATRLQIGDAGANVFSSWVRFLDVDIPQGATIDSAVLSLVKATVTDDILSNFYGSDEDDAVAVVDDTGWHNQVLTTAFVAFDFDAATYYTQNERGADTPDLSAPIQEIVDRSGWVSGNNMAIYWLDDGSANLESSKYNDHELGAAIASFFIVEWTPASPGATWASVQGGSGNNFSDWRETATTQIQASTTTNQWQNTGRSHFGFDTSALPDTDHISSATFEFVATGKTDSLSAGQSISMVTSAPASNTVLINGDFDGFGTTVQAPDLTLAALTADSSTFNTFTLSNTGKGNISKTGLSNFGTAISSDRSNSEPTWSSGGTGSVVMVTAEETLSGDKRPKLTVTHSASGPSGGTTPTSGTRISPAIDLSAVTDVAYCAIGWEASIPSGTTVTVATSTTGAAGPFTDSVNGSCPSGLTVGTSLVSVTDFRTRVTLTTTDDTITPLITALGLIVEDSSGQELYYQLITTPSATLTDRSGNLRTGTMSYPLGVSGNVVTSAIDPLRSTRNPLTPRDALSGTNITSGVSGAATNDNLFGEETGFEGLPLNSLVQALANVDNALPARFIWFIFLGIFIIGAGAAVFMMTRSLVAAAAAMAAIMGFAGAVGDGLMPLWIIFVFIPIAAVFILIRPGKLPT